MTALLLTTALFLGACAGGGPASPAPEADAGAPFLAPAEVRETPTPGIPPALLTAVRAAEHPGFDRVVFEFAEGPLPGYRVAYLQGPAHDCGSGDEKPVAGGALLEVTLRPANAHTEKGEPTIPFREQPLTLPVLREIDRTCDFEAVVTWVLGVSSQKPFRVTELSGPPRLVVDVER
ncbi:MAG TPA: hypothetical protein VLQ45_06525 [Thermoanaerobaculia bacterium]|nr:hypothetical protein [Thermoanaerobaculia bacterium]